MWFAALGRVEENPWLVRFMVRLLEGSPPVLELLAGNPFPAGPPRYVRAIVYDYRFADLEEWRSQGTWWARQEKGLYLPVLALREK